MKYVYRLSLILAAFLAGYALRSFAIKQQTDDMSDMEKADRQLAMEHIRQTEANYDKAWQQGDTEGILACFTNDAVLVSPRGDVATGKEELRTLLSNFLNDEARETKHTSRITRISFVTDDVAVVDGEAFIEGDENLSPAAKRHSFTDILVRSGDAWLISQIRAHGNDKVDKAQK